MKLLATTSLVTLDGSIAIMDNVETSLRVLDESFRVSLIFGGALVALLAVLALAPYVSVLVAEFRKARQ
ncbi:MAG: hypothetical protein IH897_16385 [Planctomycetes bacterium]|nr:hypothetical protein [Planctomycetota bacterium]